MFEGTDESDENIAQCKPIWKHHINMYNLEMYLCESPCVSLCAQACACSFL